MVIQKLFGVKKENGDTSRLITNDNDDNSEEHVTIINVVPESRSKRNWIIYKGIICSFLSSVFLSLCSVIVKQLDKISPGELAIIRMMGIFSLSLPLTAYYGVNPFGPSNIRHFLIIRGFASGIALFLRFEAFRYLPISDASVIIFSFPVFVTIFACIFLKDEPCTMFQTFTVMITIIGLVFTTKLPTKSAEETSEGNFKFFDKMFTTATPASHHSGISDHTFGVLCGLASTLFAASVFIFIRKAKGAHWSVIMFNFGWVALAQTTLLTAVLPGEGFSLPVGAGNWFLVIALAVMSFCGQFLLTIALQCETAGPVSVIRAAGDIALAICWQIFFFNDTLDLWSITGAFLVTSCVVLVGLRKWILSLPESSKLKQKLYCIVNS